ncbi:hypothetical protein PF010_g11291 [Phytophthora fragariae]|nr:hypothetical protein PF003_g13421 [Phytophthora fragariae]KAE8938642.1 hypothetical protein PF009_g11484 [Phytophthora fragariae]KAE9011781.1 hypothetical protein PF011_g9217 [Phytophthora fragariae]KAE9110110.1 hypothetical protein PF010_g11291 [Phytophthora fragariae]KAE9137600.1 hypothetical protein PF007_g1710 [Phytophthora fragariae]
MVTTLPENDTPVSEESLMYHFKKSMPYERQTNYEESGREASTLTELSRYFTRLEMQADRKDPRMHQRKDNTRSPNLPKQQRGKEPRQNAKLSKPVTGKGCSHHRTTTHSDDECQ